MRHAHTVDTVRKAEHSLMARLPHGALMRRAATGLAVACANVLPRVSGARVVLLVGSGDNGGDALFAGAFLARRGAAVRAVLAGSRTHEEGLAALRAAGGRAVTVAEAGDEIVAADLVVDGLLGIGGRGGLREHYAELARLAEWAGIPVVAVDLPSGIDADTGEVSGPAVRAHLTVTFGTRKPGLLIDPGAAHAGTVELVDIGLGPYLPEPAVVAADAADVAELLPAVGRDAHKYSRGVLGVAAGSARYPGAAVLAVGGALRAGAAGMVRYVGSQPVIDEVLRRWPETVAHAAEQPATPDRLPRVQAWLVGSGRGTGGDGTGETGQPEEAELAAILGTDLPVLLDADALTQLARHPELVRERTAPTLLTPHAGELARLLPGAERAAIEARRLAHARDAAEHYGCTVLLKGSTTVIAEPGSATAVNTTGTPLLATAGSGDVLSGMIAAFLAAGLAPREAAMCGAHLHGAAALLARDGGPISASDLFEGVPRALRALPDLAG